MASASRTLASPPYRPPDSARAWREVGASGKIAALCAPSAEGAAETDPSAAGGGSSRKHVRLSNKILNAMAHVVRLAQRPRSLKLVSSCS